MTHMVGTMAAGLRVLLALRVQGVADTPLVALRAELSEDETKNVLDSLVENGEAQYKERENGSHWRVTPEGNSMMLALLAEELDTAGTRSALTETYERFLAADFDFKKLCLDWQTFPDDDPTKRKLNDHSDHDYDRAVVAQLSLFDDSMQLVYADFAAQLERLAGFGPRFAHACDRVEAGDNDWFAGALVDSYHMVWMEMHFNLQTTLGIDRVAEEEARSAEEASG